MKMGVTASTWDTLVGVASTGVASLTVAQIEDVPATQWISHGSNRGAALGRPTGGPAFAAFKFPFPGRRFFKVLETVTHPVDPAGAGTGGRVSGAAEPHDTFRNALRVASPAPGSSSVLQALVYRVLS